MMRESQDDTVPRHRVQTGAPTSSFIGHAPRKDKHSSRAPQSPESDKARGGETVTHKNNKKAKQKL